MLVHGSPYLRGCSICCSRGLSSRVSPVSPGIIEGFKVEKASLQEALVQKETSEQGLVAELESLNQQLQRVTRQQAELKEENAVLCHQKEVAATEAEEREAGKEGCLQGWRAEHGQQHSWLFWKRSLPFLEGGEERRQHLSEGTLECVALGGV